MLGFIRRNSGAFSQSTRELLYKTYVRSVLEYACVVWDPPTARDINKLERVQNLGARPRRDLIREAAAAVVQAFPDALEDRGLGGGLLGRGYDSLFQQLESRVENVTRGRPSILPDVQKHRKNHFPEGVLCGL
ncbi:hypothetical protein MTO96_048926 [Rhipicephalus appendiculatus]